MRKLALAASIIVCLFPLRSMALGLGDITSKSFLNQPLNAEISLHSLRAGDLQDLEVRVADQRDYQRAQIPWQEWMSKVKFSVERDAKGVAFIRMTTKEPVQEPFLNFLVKAVWANGRVLKQYTLLIDPIGATVPDSGGPVPGVGPVVETQAEPEPIRTADSRSAEAFDEGPGFDEPEAAPQENIELPPDAVDNVFGRTRDELAPGATDDSFGNSGATFSGANEYTVQRGDTAWEIAMRFRQSGASGSIQQILQSLLETNPNAFVDNNVNRLKAGVLIRRPERTNIGKWSKQEAISELARQNSAFRDYQQILAQGAGEISVARSDSFADSADSSFDVADNAAAAEDDTQFMIKGVEDQTTIKGKVDLVNESISSKAEEQKDLQSKVDALQDQKKKLGSLIDMQVQALGVGGDSGGTLQDLQNDPNSPLADDLIDEPQIAGATGKPIEDLELIDENLDESGMWSLLNNPKVVGLLIGVVLVFGVLFWLVRRRSMNLDEFQESILTNAGANTSSELSQTLSSGGGLGGDSSVMNEFSASGLTSGIQSEVSVMDPLAEADVYLAYGRFQHAEELMKEAIAKEPKRLEYKAKLLEIYSAMKEKQGFLTVAQELHDATSGKGPLWEKTMTMGRVLCADSALFGGRGAASVEEFITVGATAASGHADHRLDQTISLGETSGIGGADTLDFNSEGEVPNLDETMNFNFESSQLSEFENSQATDDKTIDFSLDSTTPETSKNDDTNIIDFDFGKNNTSSADAMEETTIIRSADGVIEVGAQAGGAAEESLLNFQTLGEGDHDIPPLESTQVIHPSADNSATDGMASPFDQDMDEDSLFQDIDEVGTKLDLARAYIDMGDPDGARSILGEVIEEGNKGQKLEANELLRDIG